MRRWRLGIGVAAAALLVAGVAVAMTRGGSDDRSVAAGGGRSSTTTSSSSSTTSSSSSTSTSAAPVAAAPPSTRAPAPLEPAGLYVMNGDGSGKRLVAADAAANSRPTFSQDGRLVVYVDRQSRLRVVGLDGAGGRQLSPTLVEPRAALGGPGEWSLHEDRSFRLVFASWDGQRGELREIAFDGTGERTITRSERRIVAMSVGQGEILWSDGSRIWENYTGGTNDAMILEHPVDEGSLVALGGNYMFTGVGSTWRVDHRGRWRFAPFAADRISFYKSDVALLYSGDGRMHGWSSAGDEWAAMANIEQVDAYLGRHNSQPGHRPDKLVAVDTSQGGPHGLVTAGPDGGGRRQILRLKPADGRIVLGGWTPDGGSVAYTLVR